MRTGIWIDLLKLFLGFLVLWLVFTYLPRYLPESWTPDWVYSSDDIGISLEQEEAIGAFILENILNDMDEINNPEVDSAVWVIASRLLQNVGLTEYEYSISVVDDPLVNAMTLPGGNIIIFSGLIEFSETPEEVAAVLAHEIGHVEQRHVVDKLVTELGLTFVLAVLTGGDATLIHELSRTLISGVFSRSQEAEADNFGMQLLIDSQIDPRSLAAFFRKLNRENMGFDERLEWLMSHPHNNARIKASLEYEVPEDFASESFDLDWGKVQASL
ncbi:MAG: hypothetical protein Salg2KO_18400 [Salibacteraceae bacterium]